MNALNQTPFLVGLGRVSLQAGVLVLLVLLVLLVQWLFRKQLTPRWRCALWLLVAARLSMPVSLSSATSLFNLLPTFKPAAENQAAVAVKNVRSPEAPVAPSGFGDHVSASISASEPSSTETVAEAPSTRAASPAAVSIPASPHTPAPAPGRVTIWPWLPAGLFGAWLAGAVLLSAYVGYSSILLAKRLRKSKRIHNHAVSEVLEECQRRLKIRSPLTLVENGEITVPALYGLFRPRLLLPAGFSSRFSERELRFVFLHELAHLKRRDLFLNWLMAALQIIHWFNPLVWLAFTRWRADRELACDALALEAAGEGQNQEYGRTILRLLEGFTHRLVAPGLVGIIEDKRQLRRRISMIASYVPTRPWSLVAILLMLGLGGIGLTDALETHPSTGSVMAAATNAPATQPVVTNGAAMMVTILDAETGEPISGAEVLAPDHSAMFGANDKGPGWKTDVKGTATIRLGTVPAEPAGQNTWFMLSVRRAGWASCGASWAVEKGDARSIMPAQLTIWLKRGTTVGGFVTDESGQPLEGVRVRMFGSGYSYQRWRDRSQQFPEFCNTFENAPAIATDAAGRWQAPDFPTDLETITIELKRPDGALQRFSQSNNEVNPMSNTDAPIDVAALRAGNAAFVLKTGHTVRGKVVDPHGYPLPGVLVKEGHGAANLLRDGEFRTDGDGRFELRHRGPRQMILTAEAEGYALTSTIVDVGSETGEVLLKLDPLSPLRIRVLDGSERPIAGAEVKLVEFRTEGQVLDFKAVTDRYGECIWTNAPQAPLALGAILPQGKPGIFGFNQMIRVAAGERIATFRLREGMDQEIIVRGAARDANTAKPVVVRTVALEDFVSGFVILDQPNADRFLIHIPASRFRQGVTPSYKLRLEADGYQSLVTPHRLFFEGDWDADFSLHRGQPGGTILLSDGQPAAGAEVSVSQRELMPIYFYSLRNAPRSGAQPIRAGDNGHFEIGDPGWDAAVVIIHPEGFLATSVQNLKQQPQLKLEPWGRVEGMLRAGTNLLPRTSVCLSGGPGASAWLYNFTTQTDDNGRFVFEKVPPGENLLMRYISRRTGGPMTPAYQKPVKVKPGELVQVEYGGIGRPVIGQVEGTADWGNDDHTLTLKLPSEQPHPRLEDFATVATFEAARDAFTKNVQRRQELARRTYVLRFEPDGSFRADDVPAGNYELRIRVTEPQNPGESFDFGRQPKELGSLVRDVVVPLMPGGRSNEPLDLGTMRLVWKQPPAARPAMDLAAQTLQMKPFDLAALRGKYVVLAFWTSWSQRSAEQLQELKKQASDWERNPQLAIVGVSLDDDVAQARRAVDDRSYTWEQAWLNSRQRVSTAEAFDVNILPSICLLDIQGRIVGRDLQGEELRAAVNRALARK